MNAAPPRAFADAKPLGHPMAASGKVGVLVVNLGTPEATDYWSMRRYLKEFLSRPPRDRDAALAVVADPQPHHPDQAPERQGQGLRFHLEQGTATRVR